jgi:valyl-tRNA synthetase
MAHITKMARKIETFIWTKECQKALELIKQKYNETSILISPNSHMESHVYTMHNY